MKVRLTKADWLDHGLRTLAASGAQALKVAPMASALKVSRGSFYWHFKDIADFHTDLLRHWRQRMTDRIIQDLEAEDTEADRLNHLLRRALDADHGLDRAVRYWALDNAEVAAGVACVDVDRIAYIAGMLAARGLRDRQASARAAFLYWAYLGRMVVMDLRHASMDPADIDEISDLFKS